MSDEAKPPIRLTFAQAYSHREVLKQKQCHIYKPEDDKYLAEPGGGYATDRESAHRYTPQRAFDCWGKAENGLLIELIDQELAGELARKKCKIESVLKASLIELLKLAPNNPIARARIMADTGKMPPDTCQTYEALKEWIEENCQPVLNQEQQRVAADRAVPPPPREGVAFEITMRFNDQQHGRCDYVASRTAHADMEIRPSDITQALIEGATFADITHRLARIARDTACDRCEPEMEVQDCDYENYGADDVGDESCQPHSMNELTEKLRDYLRTTLTPEQQQRITGL